MSLQEHKTYYMDRTGDNPLEPSQPTSVLFEHYFTKTRRMRAYNGLRHAEWDITQYHGQYRCYYENGELMTTCDFVDGSRHGERVEYWPGHVVRVRQRWEHNELVA